MSQPTPFSRAMMQELKSQKEEELRQNQIKKIVEEIYADAVNIASTSIASSFNFKIPTHNYVPFDIRASRKIMTQRESLEKQRLSNPLDNTFHIKNMSDIMAGLRDLFPDCAVSHTLLCQAKDGKMYDVAKLDDAVLPFVDRALDQSYIVIDWS